jgi:hypothetical protein
MGASASASGKVSARSAAGGWRICTNFVSENSTSKLHCAPPIDRRDDYSSAVLFLWEGWLALVRASHYGTNVACR